MRVSAGSDVLAAPSPVFAAQSVSGGFLEALFHDQGCSGLMETPRVQVGAGSDTLEVPWQRIPVENHRLSSLWLYWSSTTSDRGQ